MISANFCRHDVCDQLITVRSGSFIIYRLRKQSCSIIQSSPFETIKSKISLTSNNAQAISSLLQTQLNLPTKGNRYEVYQHQLRDTNRQSVDGEGILIQECCGGTKVKQVSIVENIGNAYIGLYKVPFIEEVNIAHNKVASQSKDTLAIFVSAGTNEKSGMMNNVTIEDNIVNGRIVVLASRGSKDNIVRQNTSESSSSIKHSCNVTLLDNKGFEILSCLTADQ